MAVSQSIPVFSQRQQALITGVGFITVIAVGVAACIGLILALLWIIVHLALLTLQALIETLSVLATTFTTANPDIRLLVLALIAYTLYRVWKSRGLHS